MSLETLPRLNFRIQYGSKISEPFNAFAMRCKLRANALVKKIQRGCKVVFYQRVWPLLFNFHTFRLRCRDVKKRLKVNRDRVNSVSKLSREKYV